MKGRHHTPEQVIRKLAEGEKLSAEGQDLPSVVRQLALLLRGPVEWSPAVHLGIKRTDVCAFAALDAVGCVWPVLKASAMYGKLQTSV